jgi:proline utilization trans-activator
MWGTNKQSTDCDPGWICVLSLIFVFGAQTREPFGKQSIQRRYLRIARCYVDHLVSTTSLQNIQALMLLQLYYHNVGERNASWMLLGCASRMAIALGMHREGANVGFDSLEQNIRKQIWWTVYVFERNLSIILGRPSAIEESEITITYPEEAIESSIGLPGLTAVTASLMRLAFRTKQTMYNPSDLRSPSDGEALTSSAKVLLHDLQVWYDRRPPHLRVGRNAVHVQQSRAVLLLEILYHNTRSLVTRPFLLSRVTKQIEMVEQQDASQQSETCCMSHDAVRLADQCVADAQAVIALASRLYKEGIFNGTSWLDVYYVYQSCFIVSLNFIPQLADIPESADDQARKAAVDEILTAINGMPLAPTFRTLIQVGSQFASLVGALSSAGLNSTVASSTAADRTMFSPAAISAPITQTGAQIYRTATNMDIYHSQPPSQTTLGANVNRQDWTNATQIPWDFLGRTAYGQEHGFSPEWYAVQSGTYDDMMFPTVVGGTFGHDPAQYDWGTQGFRMGDEGTSGAVVRSKNEYV